MAARRVWILSSIGRRARKPAPPAVQAGAAISIRLAGRDEEAAIDQLAELSGCRRPPGPSLVAEVDGQIRAALSLAGRELLADPFTPTAELRSLLSLRAAQLDATDPGWGRSERARTVHRASCLA